MTSDRERLAAGPPEDEELPRMSLLQHLEELRKRILLALIGPFVAFVATWSFREELYRFLERPIRPYLEEGQKLAVLGVTDPLFLYLKIAALAAFFLASPWVLYQFWAFVSPGLYQKEKKGALTFVFFGTFFFLAGAAFAYTVAFPFMVEFLLSMGGSNFEMLLTAQRLLRDLMTILLGLGLMFELPVVIFILAQFGIVTPRFLMRHFKWAVLIIFIIAAVITPTPDPFNMFIFALPTVLLYLLGAGAAAVVARGKAKAESSG